MRSGSLSTEEEVLIISIILGLEAEEGGGRFELEPVFFLLKIYNKGEMERITEVTEREGRWEEGECGERREVGGVIRKEGQRC